MLTLTVIDLAPGTSVFTVHMRWMLECLCSLATMNQSSEKVSRAAKSSMSLASKTVIESIGVDVTVTLLCCERPQVIV